MHNVTAQWHNTHLLKLGGHLLFFAGAAMCLTRGVGDLSGPERNKAASGEPGARQDL